MSCFPDGTHTCDSTMVGTHLLSSAGFGRAFSRTIVEYIIVRSNSSTQSLHWLQSQVDFEGALVGDMLLRVLRYAKRLLKFGYAEHHFSLSDYL